MHTGAHCQLGNPGNETGEVTAVSWNFPSQLLASPACSFYPRPAPKFALCVCLPRTHSCAQDAPSTSPGPPCGDSSPLAPLSEASSPPNRQARRDASSVRSLSCRPLGPCLACPLQHPQRLSRPGTADGWTCACGVGPNRAGTGARRPGPSGPSSSGHKPRPSLCSSLGGGGQAGVGGGGVGAARPSACPVPQPLSAHLRPGQAGYSTRAPAGLSPNSFFLPLQ